MTSTRGSAATRVLLGGSTPTASALGGDRALLHARGRVRRGRGDAAPRAVAKSPRSLAESAASGAADDDADVGDAPAADGVAGAIGGAARARAARAAAAARRRPTACGP